VVDPPPQAASPAQRDASAVYLSLKSCEVCIAVLDIDRVREAREAPLKTILGMAGTGPVSAGGACNGRFVVFRRLSSWFTHSNEGVRDHAIPGYSVSGVTTSREIPHGCYRCRGVAARHLATLASTPRCVRPMGDMLVP
jgi:hypothetical protein